MSPEDSANLLYPRSTNPYNKPWEDWAAMWCNWLLSISRNKNPAIDQTGENCDQEQNDPHVWFLGGSFGNDDVIKRKCVIPYGRAIFFPILEKEDSFVEDSDLTTEEQLAQRAEHFMSRVTRLEASIDDVSLKDLRNYRVRSRFFNLTFPQNGVYDVAAGITRSVCDGYW